MTREHCSAALGDEGTSFQDVVDSVREELARSTWANPKYTLGEVAYLLGFSEIRHLRGHSSGGPG
jgi:AraC-like DNA-binding protein